MNAKQKAAIEATVSASAALDDGHCSVSFKLPDGRYHVWIDLATLSPKDSFYSKVDGRSTLYKNSHATDQWSEGYFKTRRLDGNSPANKAMIDFAIGLAKDRGLIEKSREESKAKEEARLDGIMAERIESVKKEHGAELFDAVVAGREEQVGDVVARVHEAIARIAVEREAAR